MQNYLTMTDLRKKLGNRSRSAIYNDIERGDLPKPLQIGSRLLWGESDLESFLLSRIKKTYISDAVDGDEVPKRWSEAKMDRNKNIILMRRSGFSLCKIADKHGLAGERVRQIILQHNHANGGK